MTVKSFTRHPHDIILDRLTNHSFYISIFFIIVNIFLVVGKQQN